MNFLEKHLEDPVRFARIKRWSIAVLIVLACAEIFLPLIFHSGHHHFWFEDFPSGSHWPKLPWGSIYGFASCVVIILVSKFLGKVWLMRQENYYGDDNDS